MSDKDQEHKDQIYEEFFSRPATLFRSITLTNNERIQRARLTQAYTKLNEVQKFLEGSMSEDNLAVVDMVEQAKIHLDEVRKRWREVILEEDKATAQHTLDYYFPDPRS
jgi:hypothetical protein